MSASIQALDTRLSQVETNVQSIASLLQDFISSVRELKEALPVAGSSTKPAGREPEVMAGSSSVPPGDSDDEPAGREPEETAGPARVPPGERKVEPAGQTEESTSKSTTVEPAGRHPDTMSQSMTVEPAGRDPEATSEASDVPPGDTENPEVIIRKKATGPSAIPLSPRPPRKAALRSPPTTAPDFFSDEETEKEVALSKVPTPKKLRLFANMAMPQKPAVGQDGLWRCYICNVSTFRSQVAFDRHWNLHRDEGGLQCRVCSKVLSNRRNFRQHMRNQHGVVAAEVESEGPIMGIKKPQFPCRVSGCNTVCSSTDSRTTHEK